MMPTEHSGSPQVTDVPFQMEEMPYNDLLL